MENAQVADLLDEIADLLELQEANEFRIRSYRNAARSVRDLSERIEDFVAAGNRLDKIAGVGEATAKKVQEMLDTGTCKRLEELRGETPAALTDLMGVPNLGPRKAMQVYKELGVDSLDGLENACREGRVRDLEGMGEKTEQNILKGIQTVRGASGRLSIQEAEDHVERLARDLDSIGAVKRWVVTGSYRRRKESVGDLDVLVESSDRAKAADALAGLDTIGEVIGKGKQKISVRLESGLQVDFRFFESKAFGAAMIYFTGSKAHNIKVRQVAQKRHWKLNEYGLFSGDELVSGDEENAVYGKLGMAWVPPELREDRGEVEAALEDKLPALVEQGDLRGDLHCHTDRTDGADPLEEMAEAAKAMGYQYLAVTDHSKAVRMAKGMDDDAMKKRADEIRELDSALDGLWLLAGVEVDILKSGKLDLGDKTLEGLDWVVASVHYNFNLGQREMTDRLVKAVESGVVHCLGHPTGRMIGKRDPIACDMDKVFQACRDNDVFLEISSQPERLDLPDFHCKTAREAGCRFSVATDAHKKGGFGAVRYGVDVARRGWLRKAEVVNTLTAKQLRKAIQRR